MQLTEYYNKNNIFTINSDPKTIKGSKKGFMTAILYLAPHKLSIEDNLNSNLKGSNTCPFASVGCIEACLNFSGRGQMSFTQKARIKRTLFLKNHKKEFMLNLLKRISSFIKKAKNKNMIPVVRINGTSDLLIENMKINNKSLMQHFPDIQFYDYTKAPHNKRKNLPDNYDLTYSYSDKKEALQEALEHLKNKTARVSVVFSDDLPKTWNGYKVINADKTDLRFLEPKNVICGLKFKGSKKALKKGIKSGFVVEA